MGSRRALFRGRVSAHYDVPPHECITYCSPAAPGECACPPARGGRIHLPPRRVTRWRCGRLPNYFGHLLSLLLGCISRRSVQMVSDVYLKCICLLDTSAFSDYGFLTINALINCLTYLLFLLLLSTKYMHVIH